MTKTVFYSWQSDLPNKTNRGFIRDCIDRAIRNIHADLVSEDAQRPGQQSEPAFTVEEGIKGVPGNVDVARTIFERIDNCGIFVPDISIVTARDAKRPMPNPNVLIEYGRATVSVTDNRIVPIFNTAFGNWETDRPFDMRHKNAPILYELLEEHDQSQRDAARKILVSTLEKAFRTIETAGLLDEEPEKAPLFEPIAPYEGYEGNNIPISLLGKIDWDWPGREGDHNVWLRPGPQVFLRLIPSSSQHYFEPLDLRDWMRKHQLPALFGYKAEGPKWHTRNDSGAAVFTTGPAPEDNHSVFAVGLTQIFTTGEIWGIDTLLIEPDRVKNKIGVDYPVITAQALEEGMILAISRYLRFARDVLQLEPPFLWVAGVQEIENYRLILGDDYNGRSLGRECTDSGIIENYRTPVHEILRPFFEKLWKEFGMRRPPDLSKQWENAVGFDLDT